ncbi:thioredoxin family protein [Puteibacter caeruleilacunae]|nr:thioredoxin family protein [Puteibacter caeruleilacunae]
MICIILAQLINFKNRTVKTQIMKLLKFLFLALMVIQLVIVKADGQNREIHFEKTNWSKIKKKAAKEDKLIFMDCYTSWCGPCKMMSRDVFTLDTVADFFNEKFVNCKFDMESGEGIELKKQLPIGAYPTFFLLDSEGNVVHIVVGAHSGNDFISFFKEGISENENYTALGARYEAGERGGDFMFKYLRSLRIANEDKKEEQIANNYLANLKNDDLKDGSMWSIIKYFMKDPLSGKFKYFVENRDYFVELKGAEAVDTKIYGVYRDALKSLEYYFPGNGKVYNNKLEDGMIADLMKYDFNRATELLALVKLNKYLKRNDWVNYASVVDGIVTLNVLRVNPEMPSIISQAVGNLAKGTKRASILARLPVWSQFAIDKEQNIGKKALLMESHSNILKDIGDDVKALEAKEAAEKANLEAEKQGKKIIVMPAFKMAPMQPKKK